MQELTASPQDKQSDPPPSTSAGPPAKTAARKGKDGPAAGNRGLSKPVVNFIVDACLLLLSAAMLFLAVVLRFVFPAPADAAGWTLWGRSYDDWANFQFVLVAIIALAILLHVMLHWSWVCGVVATKILPRQGPPARLDDGQQTIWGVGMLILLINVIGLLSAWAYLSIRGPGG